MILLMELPKLENLEVNEKKVIVRGDLDVDEGDVENNIRLESIVPTLKYLIEKKAKVILIGHRGRPGGKVDGKFSLHPVIGKLKELLEADIIHIHDLTGAEAETRISKLEPGQIASLMNLRFDPREKENDEEFAKRLASFAECYVNECFSTSHRKHASFVGIPKFLSHAAGFRLLDEVEYLTEVRENPKRPLVVVFGGAKEDKLDSLEDIKKFADRILVGGRLPLYLDEDYKDSKVIVARLNQDKEDITLHSIEKFEEEIDRAGTVVLAGPMGKFEEEGQKLGTQKVFNAIANSSAFKVVGGGDSGDAIRLFGLEEKFDWTSVGGGATLEFLAKGTLAGIKALKD